MKNFSISFIPFVLFACLWLASCGDEGSTDSAYQKSEDGSFVEVAKDAFVRCDSKYEDVTATAIDGRVYVCESGSWIEMEVDEDSTFEVIPVVDEDNFQGSQSFGWLRSSSSEEIVYSSAKEESSSSSMKTTVVAWFPKNANAGSIYDSTNNTLKDLRNNMVYQTIQVEKSDGTLGSVWMVENLNYAYLQPTSTEDSSSFCHMDDPMQCDIYGRYYYWSAAMDSAMHFSSDGYDCGFESICKLQKKFYRGVCPEGWHVPVKADLDGISFRYAASYMNFSREGIFLYDENTGYDQIWFGEEFGTDFAKSWIIGSDSMYTDKTDKMTALPVRCVMDYE